MPKEPAIRSTVYSDTSSPRKLVVMGPFMSQMTVSMTFIDCCTQNFFFTGESVCFHSMNYLFDSGSVNFTWFPLLSYQTFDDMTLFKPEALFDLFPFFFFNSLQNIFCKIRIMFCINQFQTMQSFHLWKENTDDKIIFLFRKKFPVVYRFYLVILLLLVHVKRSTGVRHLWVHPYFFSSVPHVWFV